MAIDPRQKELWLHEFHLNGFVILRNFLPPEFVDAMHAELTPLLEAEYAKAVEENWGHGRGTGRMALRLESYAKLMRGTLDDDRYRKNAAIEELVDAILGQGGWKRGWSQVEVCWKGAHHMEWHPDETTDDNPNPDEAHRANRVTFNIPLVDFTWANGSMEVIPGSHMLPLAFHRQMKLHDIPNLYPVLLELRRGDAVLRDGNGLHRGTPNVTDRARPMLDQTYKRIHGAT